MSELNKESVEQAGGDERAAFEVWASPLGWKLSPDQNNCGIVVAERYGHPGVQRCWEAWQARAALAQPSPKCATCGGTGMVDDGEITCSEGGIPYENGPVKCVKDCPDCKAQPSPAQAEQAEAERPEVVARVDGTDEDWFIQPEDETELHSEGLLFAGCELGRMIDFDRIVGALRADRDSWAEQAEQRLADWDEMRKERDAALARVAELERQEPVALANRGLHAFWVKWTEAAAGLYGPGIKLYAAPVAQAQHSVPEEFSFEYRHPNGESHTVTVSRDQVINEMPDFLFEALCSKFCNCEPAGETNVVECCCDEYAEEFKLLAAAPGKEVGHE